MKNKFLAWLVEKAFELMNAWPNKQPRKKTAQFNGWILIIKVLVIAIGMALILNTAINEIEKIGLRP